jgi:alpha-tubulin suppressor-like RCC1 family protein
MVDTQGQAKCWGANASGQLGNGTTTDVFNIPGTSLSISGRQVKTMALGANFTCALLDNNEVRCWGSNGTGQLGLGLDPAVNPPRTSPPGAAIDFGTGRSARAITAGNMHVCAILDDQSLSCWGNGASGQLGIGSVSSPSYRVTPQAVNLGSGVRVKSVKAGSNHTCVILGDDSVKCWGSGVSGQLGSGSNANVASALSATTIQSGGGTLSVKAIALGGQHTCAISTTGSLACWGDHSSGQLGIGPGSASYTTPQNVNLAAGVMPKSLSLGGQHSCVVLASNNVQCFGYNNSGQVVRGDNTPSFNTPVPIAPNNAGATIFAAGVSLGSAHTCAVNVSGNTINCWGDNTSGQLGGAQ